MKSGIQQKLLRAVHHAKALLGDLLPVDKAGRKTCKRLLIPCRKPQPVGEFADHALVHPHLAQRTKHRKLGNRHQSRAVIAVVVQIGRLRHVGDVVLLCNIPDLCEKLLLAEVAAVGRIMGKSINLQFLRLHHDMFYVLLLTECFCLS